MIKGAAIMQSKLQSNYGMGKSLIMMQILLIIMTNYAGVLLVSSTTFTFKNNCGYTIWPGVLANSGSDLLAGGGFVLPPSTSVQLTAPAGWAGRFWGRTHCTFDGSRPVACLSGDCGGSRIQCAGAGAATPATLAEFAIAGKNPAVRQDFYDVSLVDGYNVPIAIIPFGGNGSCSAAGCVSDINRSCPTELQVLAAPDATTTTTAAVVNGDSTINGGGNGGGGIVVGCKSACSAFNTPEYCCSGAYSTPSTCRPSVYSQLFKTACPKAYSYAYDDPTSTFTCTSPSDYAIVFCPSSSTSSQKTMTGIEQPGSALMGTQIVYASSSSNGVVRRYPMFMALSVITMSYFLARRQH